MAWLMQGASLEQGELARGQDHCDKDASWHQRTDVGLHTRLLRARRDVLPAPFRLLPLLWGPELPSAAAGSQPQRVLRSPRSRLLKGQKGAGH